MAKTLMNVKTKEVRRVSDEEAVELAKNGWRYIGKREGQRILASQQTAQ